MTKYSKVLHEKADEALQVAESLHILAGELSALASSACELRADLVVLELRWLGGDVETWARQVYRACEELRKLGNRVVSLEEQEQERQERR